MGSGVMVPKRLQALPKTTGLKQVRKLGNALHGWPKSFFEQMLYICSICKSLFWITWLQKKSVINHFVVLLMLATLGEPLSILFYMLDRGMKWSLCNLYCSCSALKCSFLCLVSYWSVGKPYPEIKQIAVNNQQVKSGKLLLKLPKNTAQTNPVDSLTLPMDR